MSNVQGNYKQEEEKVWVELSATEAARYEREMERLAQGAEYLEGQLPSNQVGASDPLIAVLREIRDVLKEIKERT